ncbi:hypothetical protein GCK32_007076 [Trichostrongylus colubriformis]|uniref:RING-type domain-containing protein n=1 Tax=Trichostrongylus colubriformis TaxID=6319 RepID=A0AAN8EWH4_TRICO
MFIMKTKRFRGRIIVKRCHRRASSCFRFSIVIKSCSVFNLLAISNNFRFSKVAQIMQYYRKQGEVLFENSARVVVNVSKSEIKGSTFCPVCFVKFRYDDDDEEYARLCCGHFLHWHCLSTFSTYTMPRSWLFRSRCPYCSIIFASDEKIQENEGKAAAYRAFAIEIYSTWSLGEDRVTDEREVREAKYRRTGSLPPKHRL